MATQSPLSMTSIVLHMQFFCDPLPETLTTTDLSWLGGADPLEVLSEKLCLSIEKSLAESGIVVGASQVKITPMTLFDLLDLQENARKGRKQG